MLTIGFVVLAGLRLPGRLCAWSLNHSWRRDIGVVLINFCSVCIFLSKLCCQQLILLIQLYHLAFSRHLTLVSVSDLINSVPFCELNPHAQDQHLKLEHPNSISSSTSVQLTPSSTLHWLAIELRVRFGLHMSNLVLHSKVQFRIQVQSNARQIWFNYRVLM